jgi:hypothetical protein
VAGVTDHPDDQSDDIGSSMDEWSSLGSGPPSPYQNPSNNNETVDHVRLYVPEEP